MLPRGPRQRKRASSAFTAIEMLVVIFIILILAAFMVVAVDGIHRRAQVRGTLAALSRLEAACQRYFRAWNAFPPDDFAGLGYLTYLDDETPPGPQPPPAGHDAQYTGAECLLIALGSPQMGGPFIDDLRGGEDGNLCDLDQDGLDDVRFTYWEFADAWGNPILYENLGDDVGVRLVSAGRDAQFGTPDDLTRP